MTRHENGYYGQPYPLSATSIPTLVAYGVLFIIFIYYLCQYLDFYPLLPLAELLWNFLVFLTPETLISVLHPAYRVSPTKEDVNGQTAPSASKNRARKSEALRKILGLDGTGILTTVQRTRSLPALGIMTDTASKAPPGLGNWDNSCYQNSILQGLASLKYLPQYLLSGPSNEEEPSTSVALKSLVQTLNSPSNAGKLIWTPPELKNMSSWQQQDAQEYFSKALDEVDKDVSQEIAAYPKNPGLTALTNFESKTDGTVLETSGSNSKTRLDQLPNELNALMARNPLEGLLAQRVGCLKCGYVEGLSLIPFNCLTVSLGRQWMYDVRTCLDDYTSLEPINGVECAKCTLLQAKQKFETLLEQFRNMSSTKNGTTILQLPEAIKDSLEERLGNVVAALGCEDFSDAMLKKCEISANNRVSTTKSKQAVIARAPKSLVIHVNRSVFDEMTGAQRKNFADVRFPPVLDLSSWCLGSDLFSGDGETLIEEWTVDPTASMLSPEIQEVPREFQKPYELRAVITHYGRHENGHYICYRKYPVATEGQDEEPTENWWRLSDDEVTEVGEEKVLSQGGVFMLFYEKLEHTPQDTTAEDIPAMVQATVPTELIIEEDIDKSSGPVAMSAPTTDPIPTEEQEERMAQTQLTKTNPESPSMSSSLEERAAGSDLDDHHNLRNLQDAVTDPTSEPSSSNPTSLLDTPSPPLTEAKDTSHPESLSTEPSSYASTRISTPIPRREPESGCDPSQIPDDAPKDSRQITHTMRTAPPRGSARRGSMGMGQVSSMISAN